MEKRLFFLLNIAQHRMFKYAEQQCESQLNISVTQAAALMFIAKNEGCMQIKLAEALGLKKSAVSGLIGRMEKNDLVYRQASDEDKRAFHLFLKEAGKSKLPDIFPLIQALNKKLLGDFAADEIEVITRFLNKVNHEFK